MPDIERWTSWLLRRWLTRHCVKGHTIRGTGCVTTLWIGYTEEQRGTPTYLVCAGKPEQTLGAAVRLCSLIPWWWPLTGGTCVEKVIFQTNTAWIPQNSVDCIQEWSIFGQDRQQCKKILHRPWRPNGYEQNLNWNKFIRAFLHYAFSSVVLTPPRGTFTNSLLNSFGDNDFLVYS